MTTGYWYADYWSALYWHDDYWSGGPVAAPVVVPPTGLTGAISSPSRAAICSAAFIHLGRAPIATMEDNSPRAAIARLDYQTLVDALIEEHRWKFSLVLVKPARVAVDPVWRWKFGFQLPASPYCLKVWRTSLDQEERGRSRRWEVQGRLLLSDTDDIEIEYGARILDPAVFDTQFRLTLEYKMAAAWAYALTGKLSVAQDMRKLYEIELARAKSGDSQQKSPRVIRTTTYTRVR